MASFEDAWRMYEEALTRTVLRWTGGNRQWALDILQDTAERAMKQWPNVTRPWGFLRETAFNVFRTDWRRHRRSPTTESITPESVLPDDKAARAMADVEGSDLSSCVAELTDRERRAFLLAYYLNKERVDIAIDMRSSAGAINGLLRRARLRVLACLKRRRLDEQ